MRVLFLTHRLPYAPNRGDRIRAFHMALVLATHADLEIVSLVHDRGEEDRADLLRALGARVTTLRTAGSRNLIRGALTLTGHRPLTHALLDAPGMAAKLRALTDARPPDVVLAYCSGMARFALEPPLARHPFVVDFVDVDSEKWRSFARGSAAPKRWLYAREARCLAQFERVAALKAHATLVVNEREGERVARLAPEAVVHVLPNGIDAARFRPPGPPVEQPRVVFCGVMNYRPNVEAVRWFARDVWPLIVARRSDAQLVIVGSNPTREVRRLAARDKTIEVTGAVDDVRVHLWRAAVSVAPLLTAQGIQNKVLEALAAGLPAVITETVSEGLPAGVRAGCFVADGADDFAGRVTHLLAMSGEARRSMAASANLTALTWDRQFADLVPILEDAAAGRKSTVARVDLSAGDGTAAAYGAGSRRSIQTSALAAAPRGSHR
jgi:sugar transferase (PEP-CTERM/EpsH1 system associated)